MRATVCTGFLCSLSVLAFTACGRSQDVLHSDPSVEPRSPQADATATDILGLESTQWVRQYDPTKAFNGYTLAFHKRRIPILMDMNGRILHAWPDARTRSRIRLLEDGALLALTLDGGVAEYSWDGDLTWKRKLEKGFAHHDVIRLSNDNTLLIVRQRGMPADVLTEIDRDGEVIWQWRSGDHLAELIEARGDPARDSTHINSVQEIPENDWYRQGDERFRPGNLLVSARNIDLVFIVDRSTDEVVWIYGTDLDRQHEALMIEPGLPGAGRILVFNNRYRSFHTDRQSSVVEVDPSDDSVAWRYEAAGFYSPTGAIEQPLPNGNVLITSSRGGRVFEVTRQGETVWEWTPPQDPVRPRRYPYDHCPQFASLGPPTELPVEPAAGYRHIDRDVYRFSRQGARRKLMLDGKKRTVLKGNPVCRSLILPTEASAELGYGLDRRRLTRAGRTDLEAEFLVTLKRGDTGEALEIFRDTLDLSGPSWKGAQVDLSAFEHERVELCLSSQELSAPGEGSADRLFYWASPVIGSAGESGPGRYVRDPLEGMTDEEKRNTREHLKALGYID